MVSGKSTLATKWVESIIFKQCWYPDPNTDDLFEKYCHNGESNLGKEIKVDVGDECPWRNNLEAWEKDGGLELVQAASRVTIDFHDIKKGETFWFKSFYKIGGCEDSVDAYAPETEGDLGLLKNESEWK